jgi:hypothetical protein
MVISGSGKSARYPRGSSISKRTDFVLGRRLNYWNWRWLLECESVLASIERRWSHIARPALRRRLATELAADSLS